MEKKRSSNDCQEIIDIIPKILSKMIKSSGEQIGDSQMRFFHDQTNMYIYKMKRFAFFNKISC